MDNLSKYAAKTTAVVVTTAMLTFVNHWRAAAVVLCDLGSSAFYACGIAEQAIGKAAPWYVFIIMCFALCVRAVYMESCTMFVRGGVYRVVKKAIGATLGKISVSALLFDYSLTGPISAVSAGHYLCGFINHILEISGAGLYIPRNLFATIFAVFSILYFWRKNVIGIEESSGKSLRIVQLSMIVLATLFIWSVVTLLINPQPLPPFTPHATDEALGWLKGEHWFHSIGVIGVFIALGHSLLAMSGEESLAQLYRELAHPKVKNLKRAAIIIFFFSIVVTGILSLFAVMIIPDDIRPNYYDNLFGGLSMHLAGPTMVKLVLQGLVVLVGGLLLTGAINTALVGANGALNRLGEDGIITPWFRQPHPKYGTTHRFLTSLMVIQVTVTVLCFGDVFLLGEAYAFGVVWCFISQTFAVLVLRWKDRSPREFMVPFNIKVGSVHVPLGIALTFIVLFLIGIVNLFTKTIATKGGIAFTCVFFILLKMFEMYNRRHGKGVDPSLEMVNFNFNDTATPEACGCTHEERILVAARDPNNLAHLKEVLEHADPEKTDVLVMTVKKAQISKDGTADGIDLQERLLVTNIVALAEKYGVNLKPILVPAYDPTYAIAKAAYDLGAKEIVLGKSPKVDPEVQLEHLAMAWGFVSASAPKKMTARVVWPGHEMKYELS
jgi:amino acid transporter